MGYHRDDLIDYVAGELLTTASRLQSGKEESSEAYAKEEVMDDFGTELIRCISDLSVEEVCLIATPRVCMFSIYRF